MNDANCLSCWFPKLVAAGVPVPRTEIVHTEVDLSLIRDGEKPEGYDGFIKDLWGHIVSEPYVTETHSPLFLRTGLTSGKHDWERTCFLPKGSHIQDLRNHVMALVEFSALLDFMGLPTNVWAVREFLPLWSTFTAFRGMPIACERRLFIRDGKIQCNHSYWPKNSIRYPSHPHFSELLDDYDVIYGLCDSQWQVAVILEQLKTAFPAGYWSLDICLCRDGRWVVTDMAAGDRSFHWPTCPYAGKRPS